MSNYRDLRAWNSARSLVASCYEATARMPRGEEYGFKSQIRRAAVSVPANIAEGSGRYSDRDFLRFVRIARGSVSELETLVTLAADVGYLERGVADEVGAEAAAVGRMLSGLADHLRQKARGTKD